VLGAPGSTRALRSRMLGLVTLASMLLARYATYIEKERTFQAGCFPRQFTRLLSSTRCHHPFESAATADLLTSLSSSRFG
jgi:hypothetical protein